ncbi:MAG: putative toxin-antitoxin system toxin component, PIN family [Burkholderiales bacterium]|nr:putative toxin-antitoxin system toxin component, PIN family [Burkholderiales bacterium]
MPDIVLDTNVLLTALRSSRGTSYRLLSMVEHDRFQLHVSIALVAEYEAVLKRGSLALSESQIDDVVDFLCSRAHHHKIYYLWRPVLKDPGDDFVLELAIKAQARIITWNIADFKRAQALGVLVQTPGEFLNFLEGKQP